MADNPTEQDQTAATEQPSKKRRLRPATSVREQSRERQVREATPKRGRRVVRAAGKPFRAGGRQVAKLGRFRVLRFIGRILWPRYFRESFRELKLVSWPDRRTTLRLTFAVIIFSFVFGFIVFGVDKGLDIIFRSLILKK